MSAQHFSDNESADWLDDDSAAPIPQVSETLFRVPVSEDASADEAARLRVEEIMRELEEELRSTEAHARAVEAEGKDSSNEEQSVAQTEKPVPSAADLVDAGDIDEPELQPANEESAGSQKTEEGSVESTLVLDRSRLGSALRERDAEGEVLDERKRERLEVNSDLHAASRETGLSIVRKEEPRRPLGFFAAIGAFVARVLHLDDR